MSNKRKKEIPVKEDEVVKTSEYKNFINELNAIDRDISEDIKEKEFISRRNVYLSFGMRTFINSLVLFFVVLAFIGSVMLSFGITKEELIRYKVTSDIDYRVYLKPNEFYETPYLEKDMVYVASLIDKIAVDYNYKFDVSRKSNIDFDYKVIAKLVIESQLNKNVFYEKEYELSEGQVDNMVGEQIHGIIAETSVDYTYYNTLANKFRSKYAVNTNSYLEVYLLVNEKSAEGNTYKLDNNSKAILTIPLSQQEINIELNNKNIDENKQVLAESKFIVKNKAFVFISALLLVFMVILIIELIRKILVITKKRSKYDSYINRILKGYDRIIVNIKTMPNFENYNIIKVESFQELIDVRDNFKTPINYYVITEHQKSEFFVTNNNDLYIYVVKAIDLDKEK